MATRDGMARGDEVFIGKGLKGLINMRQPHEFYARWLFCILCDLLNHIVRLCLGD